jgi:hypothetical protein
VGRAASVAVAALGLACAGAALATARRPASGPTPGAVDALVAAIDARLREAASAASTKAQTLADLPRLAVAVATDVATVRDLTREELAFQPREGETIEIAQVARGAAGATPLLRLPEGSSVSAPLAQAGTHLICDGDALLVAVVVEFEPSERAGEVHGIVAVSRPVKLDPGSLPLEPLGGGARLEAGMFTHPLGEGLPADAATTAVTLPTEPRWGARIVVRTPTPGGWRRERLAIGGALATLALVGAGLIWRRSAPAPRAPGLSPATTPGSAGSAPIGNGSRIGRYAVLDLLGSGGMADVFLARAEGEAGFERLVALKVMHEDMASNPRFVSHFLDEARLAPKLNHPNIVAITDLGKEGEKYVIAMEFIDGADLDRLLCSAADRQIAIPVGVALAIVRRVCDGLHFAHTAIDGNGQPLDVVHRDVKGANVFVARNGAVKIGDFGIAKIAGMRAARTEHGEVKGTVQYMAPEQRLGQAVDARADLYAVGAICYELLTGRQINLDLAMLAHLGREGWPHLPPLSRERPELPAELDAVVFRAMAYAREDRYPSCEAFEAALAEIVERHGLGASDKAIAKWIAGELPALPAIEREPGGSLPEGWTGKPTTNERSGA